MARDTKKAIIPPEIKSLGKVFANAGFEIRIVGGWVRDTLRGVPPKDLDLATTATPEQMIALCEKHGIRYFETGLQHGTISVLYGGIYEITTLRIDRETDGRHATVEFTTDWRIDAERRDFTINSMSMSLDGKVFDYFGGREHLKNNQVVFVGNAQARIREDYLRILRYFRFRGRIGDYFRSQDTLDTIAFNAAGLEQISSERIWMEMAKILSGDEKILFSVLSDMLKTGVFDHIDLATVGTCDILAAAMVRRQTANPLTVLAALTGTNIADIWKMSGDEKKLLKFLQPNRVVITNPAQFEGVGRLCPDLAFLKDIAVTRSHSYAIECACLFGGSDTLNAIRAWTLPQFPVTGEDLIARGIEPGREMGQILNRLMQVWKDSDYQIGKDVLLELV